MARKSGSVRLERSYFVVNSAGDNEFDWVLQELGYSAEESAKLDAVEIDAVVVEEEKVEE